jgi:RecA-family ATPase
MNDRLAAGNPVLRGNAINANQHEYDGSLPKSWSAAELEEEYRRSVRTDFSKTAFDLHTLYPTIPHYRVYPGEVVVIIGDTGLGKTAFLQNIVVSLRMDTLWFSLENHAQLQYRRYVQIAHEMPRDAVAEYYRHNTNSLSRAVSHIKNAFYPPKLSELKELIVSHTPRILVIDTLDGIVVEGVKDPVAQVEKSIIRLKGLAQELNVIIIAIHHVPKSATVDYRGNRKKLTKHSGRGSSSVEQKADKVITIEGNEAGDIREVRSVKARDEAPFTQFFRFDKETFRFTPIGVPPPKPALPSTRGVRLSQRKELNYG